MTRNRGPERNTRSALAELLVLLIIMGAIVLFLAAGGPSIVGGIWAELAGNP